MGMMKGCPKPSTLSAGLEAAAWSQVEDGHCEIHPLRQEATSASNLALHTLYDGIREVAMQLGMTAKSSLSVQWKGALLPPLTGLRSCSGL